MASLIYRQFFSVLLPKSMYMDVKLICKNVGTLNLCRHEIEVECISYFVTEILITH